MHITIDLWLGNEFPLGISDPLKIIVLKYDYMII